MANKTPISVVSFVRKALKVKGSSSHNGRGAYDCRVNDSVTYEQMKEKMLTLCAEWKADKLITDFKLRGRDNFQELVILFSYEHFKEHYREVLLQKGNYLRYNEYQVGMIFHKSQKKCSPPGQDW